MRSHLSRRSLFALIGLAAAARPALAAPPSRQPVTVELLRRPVAGLFYYDYARVADTLSAGAPLRLRRQPANPYDRRAIEVLTEDGTKLGYVPRADNTAVAALMDAGYEMRARVVRANAKRWVLQMAVSMVERNHV